MATASLNNSTLEDMLLIHTWGFWTRPRIEAELGVKPQPCFRQWRPPYPRESSPFSRDGIDEEYMQILDALVAALFIDTPERRDVVFKLYVDKLTVRQAAKELDMKEHKVKQERDIALGMLYGALSYKLKGEISA